MRDFVKNFKTINNKSVNIVKHTLDILKEDPTVKIYIGTDSQNVKRRTNYVTVIAYRYNNKGVHYIYNKISIKPKIKNLFNRLFKEVEMSIEVAEWFTKQINVKVAIDLDYNEDSKYKSHVVLEAAKGWAQSLGYETNSKESIPIATRAADWHVR
jgi:predicted RNase H-related nuclease YkuK (DUF458 family)